MREFAISIAIGFAVGGAWFALWSLALRPFGISYFVGTQEKRAIRRERIARMGKLRYTLIFGVLGHGITIGLVMATADLVAHGSRGWSGAVIKLVLWTVLFGWWHGVRTWNDSFRGEVPFPPPFPPHT